MEQLRNWFGWIPRQMVIAERYGGWGFAFHQMWTCLSAEFCGGWVERSIEEVMEQEGL